MSGKLGTTAFEYNEWANELIFNLLKELPEEVYRQEVHSLFPSLSHVLAHVYLSDIGWLEVFSSESMNNALEPAERLKRGKRLDE